MIEFAAGIMVGGSVGAVIMGALLAQTRAIAADVRKAAVMQARAPMQARQHVAPMTAQHRGDALSLLVPGHAALAAASAQLH